MKRVNLSICQLLTVQRKTFGFTLIELLVVISIIAILITVIVATFGTTQKKARDSNRKTDLDAIKKALELFKSDTKGAAKYPDSIYASIDGGPNDLLTLEYAKYIKETPTDPSIVTVNGGQYIYTPNDGSGGACSGGGNTTTAASDGSCVDYTLTACLENTNDSDADNPAVTACSTSPNDYASYTITAP